MVVWLGGRVIADGDARVSVFDRGFTVGDGVFESLKAVDGVPFALNRHLARLDSAARVLGLPPPDLDEVRAACHAVLDAEDAAGAHRLRITYTAGPGQLGSRRSDAGGTLVVARAPIEPWPVTTRVVTAPWVRNGDSPLAGVKSTSYAENVLALALAAEVEASEAVFGNTRGRLCEGTGSNVFVVMHGRLCTPPLDSGCLAGVTRALIVQWCGAEEVDLPLTALDTADEVFLTSSTREVQGCHDVDGRPLEAPGWVTQQCAAEFALRSAESSEP